MLKDIWGPGVSSMCELLSELGCAPLDSEKAIRRASLNKNLNHLIALPEVQIKIFLLPPRRDKRFTLSASALLLLFFVGFDGTFIFLVQTLVTFQSYTFQ